MFATRQSLGIMKSKLKGAEIGSFPPNNSAVVQVLSRRRWQATRC